MTETFPDTGQDLLLFRKLLEPTAADVLLASLLASIDWQTEQLKLYGRQITVPRLMAWHGEPNVHYRYSGVDHVTRPWTRELQEVREVIESRAGHTFNSVLLNLYRDGNDSMSWHSDDEPEMGEQPVIASLSLGAERDFQLRHRQHPERKLTINLPHGSLLLMRGNLQRDWQHQLPKRKRVTEPRVNLTFRHIL